MHFIGSSITPSSTPSSASQASRDALPSNWNDYAVRGCFARRRAPPIIQGTSSWKRKAGALS
ncbi:MAG: hypothetical protein OXU63_11805 [Acidobacteriota bacterium]|nr:hypothetical protein [Acidobacteriota bacterium]